MHPAWVGAGGSGQAGTVTSLSPERGQSPSCPGDTENISGTLMASYTTPPRGHCWSPEMGSAPAKCQAEISHPTSRPSHLAACPLLCKSPALGDSLPAHNAKEIMLQKTPPSHHSATHNGEAEKNLI